MIANIITFFVDSFFALCLELTKIYYRAIIWMYGYSDTTRSLLRKWIDFLHEFDELVYLLTPGWECFKEDMQKLYDFTLYVADDLWARVVHVCCEFIYTFKIDVLMNIICDVIDWTGLPYYISTKTVRFEDFELATMLVTLVLFFLMEQYFFDFYHLKSSRDFLKQLPKDIYNFPQRYRDGDFQHVTLPYFLFQCKVFVYETVLDIVFNPPKLFLFIFVLYLFGW